MHFTREAGQGLYVRFLDVASADTGPVGAEVWKLAEAPTGTDLNEYKLRGDSGVHSTVVARSWTWHPVSADEVFGFELLPDQQHAVMDAMRKVVARDTDAVRAMLIPEYRDDADQFWMWADSYGDEGRLELMMPPGEVEDWKVGGTRHESGVLSLEADVWARGGRTDLMLVFVLRPAVRDGYDVEIESLRVL